MFCNLQYIQQNIRYNHNDMTTTRNYVKLDKVKHKRETDNIDISLFARIVSNCLNKLN